MPGLRARPKNTLNPLSARRLATGARGQDRTPPCPSCWWPISRVSTREQGRSGLGLDAQRAAVARFAETEGFEIVAEHVEIETGKGADYFEGGFPAAANLLSRAAFLAFATAGPT